MTSFLAQSSSASPLSFLIFLLPIGLLFFLMRSQKRRLAQQQNLQHSVGQGDEILTTGGIFGTVVDIDEDEDTLVLEIAPGTRIKMVRAGVARRLTEDDEDELDDDEQGSAWGDGDEQADAGS